MRKYSYQLDNLHQAGQEWWPDDELEKALDGYAVWPLRPITDPEPVPPGVLSADNAQAYIDRFSAHIATLTQDMPALQRQLVRRGMAYQLAGKIGAAQDDYLRAMDSPHDYVATPTLRLALLLPKLADRSRALDGIRRAHGRLKQQPYLVLKPQEIAAALRKAREKALAASFAELARNDL
jgi:hypothetical protein